MATISIPGIGIVTAPAPGPTSIFVSGILDFSSQATPAVRAVVDICDDGSSRTVLPNISKTMQFSLSWTYASRAEAENIVSEFTALGMTGFIYTYKHDNTNYLCFWVNFPVITPVEYSELWNVSAEFIGIRA